jgi:hypothetical protein
MANHLYRNQGQEEKRRAEEEGHLIYNKTKEVVLRPKVAGGILGLGSCGPSACISKS